MGKDVTVFAFICEKITILVIYFVWVQADRSDMHFFPVI